jgi:2'-5' RNA ligase
MDGDRRFEAGERLFFALFPPPEAQERITALAETVRRNCGWTGRVLAPQRLHVTLAWLGDHDRAPTGLVNAAREAGRVVRRHGFEMVFDRVAGSTSLVLLGDEGLNELRSFRADLADAMSEVGLGPFARAPFKPHMTLLYDDCRLRETPVEPIAWIATELVLVLSRVGRTQHIPLARWPLGDLGEGTARLRA